MHTVDSWSYAAGANALVYSSNPTIIQVLWKYRCVFVLDVQAISDSLASIISAIR